MNILEIVSGTGIDGATRHGVLLSRELARRGNRVTLACRPGSWIAGQLHGESVRVVESRLYPWSPSDLRRMTDLARRQRIDVIHTHMSRAHFFGVMLRLASGLPCVATAHSRHVQLHWRFNDLVIAVSEATRRYHQRWNRVTAERIVTIPNSVNRQRLETAAAPQRARVRAELGLDDSWILLGTIGSVIPRKGILYLVRVFPRFSPPRHEHGWRLSTRAASRATRPKCGRRSVAWAWKTTFYGWDLATTCPGCSQRWTSMYSLRWKRACRWRSWRRWRQGCRWWRPRSAACLSAFCRVRRECWFPRPIVPLSAAP